MDPYLFTIGSVVLVSLVSFVGIFLIGFHDHHFNKMLSVMISFAVGGLLGDVFIHILPEMVKNAPPEFFPKASILIVAGIFFSFILEKVIHWRHCHAVDDCEEHTKPVGLVSLFGDAVHNITDGILIAGSYLVNVPTGIATTVAVVLHEIPQEIGDYAILRHSGYSKGRALFLNFLTALTAVLGAILVLVLQNSMPDIEQWLLPLVAGNFLYIAIADLLPELHKHTRVKQSLLQVIGVVAGIGIMACLKFVG